MRPNRLAAVLAVLAVTVVTGGTAGNATAAPASCRVDTSTTEETPGWLSSTSAERVVEALGAALDRPVTTAAGKPDGLDSLQRASSAALWTTGRRKSSSSSTPRGTPGSRSSAISPGSPTAPAGPPPARRYAFRPAARRRPICWTPAVS